MGYWSKSVETHWDLHKKASNKYLNESIISWFVQAMGKCCSLLVFCGSVDYLKCAMLYQCRMSDLCQGCKQGMISSTLGNIVHFLSLTAQHPPSFMYGSLARFLLDSANNFSFKLENNLLFQLLFPWCFSHFLVFLHLIFFFSILLCLFIWQVVKITFSSSLSSFSSPMKYSSLLLASSSFTWTSSSLIKDFSSSSVSSSISFSPIRHLLLTLKYSCWFCSSHIRHTSSSFLVFFSFSSSSSTLLSHVLGSCQYLSHYYVLHLHWLLSPLEIPWLFHLLHLPP